MKLVVVFFILLSVVFNGGIAQAVTGPVRDPAVVKLNAQMDALYDAGDNEIARANALSVIQKEIDAGNVDAMFRLGRYYHLETMTPNYAKSFELYTAAMGKGHAWAINNMGLLYLDGLGVPQDFAKARALFEQAAAKKEEHAYGNLARMYFNGQGVPVDAEKGIAWFVKMGSDGLSEGYHEAGELLMTGRNNVPIDMTRAFDYFSKAYAAGNLEGGWHVARAYLDGDPPVGLDKQKALEILLALSDKGSGRALNTLGSMYEHGNGVTRDLGTSLGYYERAVNVDDCEAIRNVGRFYEKGILVPQNDAIATDYILKAAACGNYNDAFDVWKAATRYRDARGIERDCQAAAQLMVRAIELGHLVAINDMGFMFDKGCGDVIMPNAYQAFNYYLIAAKLGDATAQNNVGAFLKHGKGVENVDRAKAFAWLKLAESNGNDDAVYNLEEYASMFDMMTRWNGMKHLAIIKKNIKDLDGDYEKIIKDQTY